MIVVCVASGVKGPYKLVPGTTVKRLHAFGSIEEADSDFFSVMMAATMLFFSFGAHPA